MVDATDIAVSVVTILLSGFLSYIVASRTGPGAVAKDARKREHSMNLVKGALTPWLDDPGKFCRVGAAIKGTGWGDFALNLENEGGGVILQRLRTSDSDWVRVGKGVEVRSPIDPSLEYFDQFKVHLDSTQPKLIAFWYAIKSGVDGLNHEILDFLKTLGQEVASVPTEIQHFVFFFDWDGIGEPPNNCLLLNDIIYWMWSELQDRASGRARRPYQIPQIAEQKSPKGTAIYEVRWKGESVPLVRTTESEVCKAISDKIVSVCSSVANIGTVRKFLSRKEELEATIERFRQGLREIKTRVDLGQNLDGKCSYCEVSKRVRLFSKKN